MNLNQLNYWPVVIISIIVFSFLVVWLEKRFFKFVKTYWFYNRSFFSYFSSVLFLLGMGGLIFSLLDLRGPEEKIKVEAPSERTIILLDTSASMLAEDVKPNRLGKAVLIAKHFARKAAGHQISIVAFAEIQKKIIPFTNDIDLIDARLESLKNLRNHYGSSALSVALQESIQYLKDSNGEARGNILVLTDGEETAEGLDLKVPKEIHVALVGIGTPNGGRIPLDDGRGVRFGYKKVQGRDVITKLEESFFKDVVATIPSGKYWPTNTYSLPSEEILTFFQGEKVKGKEQQDMVVKPVLMEWIVVPSIILLFLSYFFKALRVFTLTFLIIISPLKAQDESEPKFTPEMINRLEELRDGKLSKLERIKLADDLQKNGAKEEALALYEENLSNEITKEIPEEAYLNYGTSLLEKGDVQNALSMYQKLADSLDDSANSKKIKEIMEKNIVSFFQQQEQKKKEQKDKKDKQDKSKDKDQKDGQSGSGQKKDSQDGKSEKSPKQDKKDKKDGSDSDKKDKKDDESGDEQDKKDKPNESENKDQESKTPKAPQKVPAKLKQLMSDDRQLQMKMIENGTRDLNRRKSRKSKDW
jgi:Ca-activated chloride channel family protein